MVIELIATSAGSASTGMRSRSITTLVSSRPRSGRGRSGTGLDVLVGEAVDVASEPVGVDRWSGAEGVDHRSGTDEAPAAKRRELAANARYGIVRNAPDGCASTSRRPLTDRRSGCRSADAGPHVGDREHRGEVRRDLVRVVARWSRVQGVAERVGRRLIGGFHERVRARGTRLRRRRPTSTPPRPPRAMASRSIRRPFVHPSRPSRSRRCPP